MKHKALQELTSIMKEPSLSIRQLMLNEWEQKWVFYTEETQHVINKSTLASDDVDFVWYKLAEQCGETLMDENVTENSTTNNSFTCKIWALRRPNAKLKEDSKVTKKA